MLVIDYERPPPKDGKQAPGIWGKPQIIPYGDLEIATTATSLHYGISVYDSMNISANDKTGKVQAFRPKDYLSSFLASSQHLDMPGFDPAELMECIKQLANLEKEWIPKIKG